MERGAYGVEAICTLQSVPTTYEFGAYGHPSPAYNCGFGHSGCATGVYQDRRVMTHDTVSEIIRWPRAFHCRYFVLDLGRKKDNLHRLQSALWTRTCGPLHNRRSEGFLQSLVYEDQSRSGRLDTMHQGISTQIVIDESRTSANAPKA